MGTHPIFESDFDCLTERKDVGMFEIGSFSHNFGAESSAFDEKKSQKWIRYEQK